MSRATTKFEVCRFKDMPFTVQRFNAINFTGGPVNALQIMQEVCNFPTHDQMLSAYLGNKIDYKNAIVIEKDKVLLEEEEEGLVEKEEDEVETELDQEDDSDE